MSADYTREQFSDALRSVGLKPGDIVFSHSNVGYFGRPEGGMDADSVFQTILGAFLDVIGDEGTLVVPTFSYSFCKRQPFDVDRTPSSCGVFSELLRKHARSVRSEDPIFSVAAIGAKAEELTGGVPVACFGPNSFWDRFLHADGVICNMNFDAGSTFIHYVERCLNVPYRYDKLFAGQIVRDGKATKGTAIFFCTDLTNPDTTAAFEPFDRLAREKGHVNEAGVGRGSLTCLSARDTYDSIESQIQSTPWLLTAAQKEGVTPRLIRKSGAQVSRGELAENATMDEMIDALWRMPRDIVSDGYDEALEALAEQVPMTIHEYPVGTECWTWIVPEKWTCHEAYLETLSGERLFAYADNPLHVMSYSLPFDGEVTREELFEHLHVHAKLPDAVPFKFCYYERDWGLCCSRRLKESLTDDRYRVVIRSEHSFGTLKVGEVVVPGETDETFVLAAHLCHPAAVNDDLTGVVVGLDAMRELMKRKGLRYTYRFLIVPETIGSVAYLSDHEELIPKMVGGLFLEILGLANPHALQLSFAGDSQVDKCLSMILQERDSEAWVDGFRKVIGNDERQFNAPGVRVPMLSLSRCLHQSDPDWPYVEYHTHFDSPESVTSERLCESRDMVLAMIDAWEQNVAPRNLWKGEIFCSRYGIHIDHAVDPEAHGALFHSMDLIDGTRSVVDIAQQIEARFDVTVKILALLHEKGLIGNWRSDYGRRADS